jgi:hypothetical protein
MGLLFPWSAHVRFKWSPATVTAAPHTLVVNVWLPLRISMRWLKGVALSTFGPKYVTSNRHVREVERELCILMSISFRIKRNGYRSGRMRNSWTR